MKYTYLISLTTGTHGLLQLVTYISKTAYQSLVCFLILIKKTPSLCNCTQGNIEVFPSINHTILYWKQEMCQKIVSSISMFFLGPVQIPIRRKMRHSKGY